jgi:hypothetical protein
MKTSLHFLRKFSIALAMSFISFVVQSQTPFTCQDGVSYIVKTSGSVSTLFRVSLVPSYSETSLGNVRTTGNVNIPVDAIGYNVVDNFIYGFERGTTNVVRIGNDGTSVRLAVTSASLPSSSGDRQFTAGDVDASGNLFLYQASAGSMYKINLNATVPYTATAITGSAANLLDISVNDAGTQAYGYSAGTGVLVVRSITGSAYTQSTAASNVSLHPCPLLR